MNYKIILFAISVVLAMIFDWTYEIFIFIFLVEALIMSPLRVFGKKAPPTKVLLYKLIVLSEKDLNLDDSIKLIEYAREYSMIYIEKINQNTLNPQFKELINQLLGLILQVPRSDDQDLAKAIEHVDIINNVSIEIKQFFLNNQEVLKQYTQ